MKVNSEVLAGDRTGPNINAAFSTRLCDDRNRWTSQAFTNWVGLAETEVENELARVTEATLSNCYPSENCRASSTGAPSTRRGLLPGDGAPGGTPLQLIETLW